MERGIGTDAWDDGMPGAYLALADQLHALLSDETDAVAHLANAAEPACHNLPSLNWPGS